MFQGYQHRYQDQYNTEKRPQRDSRIPRNQFGYDPICKAPLSSENKRESYDSRVRDSNLLRDQANLLRNNQANRAAAPISGQGKGGPSAADL